MQAVISLHVGLSPNRAPRGLRRDSTLAVGAATIGNFDGVHLGHQAVLRQLRREANALGLETCVIGFVPHPREHLARRRQRPGRAEKAHSASSEAYPMNSAENAHPAACTHQRLDRLPDQLDRLARQGVSRLVLLRFASVAGMSAEDFASQVLFERLGVRCLVVGDDFRFGRGREGDHGLLAALGEAHDCRVRRVAAYCAGGQRVSSSRIRVALAAGDLALANRLLGRPLRLSGRVGHGEQRGRQLGWPTANIRIPERLSLVRGVFTARVHGIGASASPAIAYCGRQRTLEVHVLDCQRDLYGQRLRVDLLERLREHLDFPKEGLLRRQLCIDVLRARALLGLEAE